MYYSSTELGQDRNGPAIAQHAPLAVFVGPVLAFSDASLRVLRSEMRDHTFLRIDAITQLSRDDLADAPLRVLILAEDLADDLIASPDLYGALARGARLVVAYRADTVARRVFAARGRHPTLAAVSLLPMDIQLDTWLSLVRLLICGQRYVPVDLIQAELPCARTRPEPAAAPRPMADGGDLTPREWQVLELVAAGKQNKIVAGELNLSEHTVKLHMHHIISKLGVRNRTGATAWFLARSGPADGRPAA
ncbi:MAG: response regulator transcription factor [Pseudomonadota bacterium]